MRRNHAIALLGTWLAVGCSVPDPEDTGSRGSAKNDDLASAVWRYQAGKEPWVTCANADSRVTCRLEPTADPIRPSQVAMGKGAPIYFARTLTDDAPEYVLPELFPAGSTITLAARPRGGWTGDVIGQLAVAASGASSTYSLPYDVWRVTITKLDESEVSLILRYEVSLAKGTFAISKTSKQDYLGTISLAAGSEGDSLSATFHFPTSPGGKVVGYRDVAAVYSQPPQFTLDKPGCYLVKGGRELIWDDGCQQTSQILRAPTQPRSDVGPTGTDAGAAGPDAGGAPPDPGPPPDPCQGACTASQACVAGACVQRADQTQSSSCYSPTKTCDPGQDGDCADGHVCVGGLCRRLTCQTQSSSCFSATMPCDPGQDADCAPMHQCKDAVCWRSTCLGS